MCADNYNASAVPAKRQPSDNYQLTELTVRTLPASVGCSSATQDAASRRDPWPSRLSIAYCLRIHWPLQLIPNTMS